MWPCVHSINSLNSLWLWKCYTNTIWLVNPEEATDDVNLLTTSASLSDSAQKQSIYLKPPHLEANLRIGWPRLPFSELFFSFLLSSSIPSFHSVSSCPPYLLVWCSIELKNNRQEWGGRQRLSWACHQSLNGHLTNTDRGRKQTTNRKPGLTIESAFL